MTTQTAPWPDELQQLVKACKYRDGWRFFLHADTDRGQGSNGTTLEIIIDCVDTYKPEDPIRIRHSFIVPAASYNMRSWRRWLFERILDVEKHEAMEFFQIAGARPYAPNHGPGHDPYTIFEEGTLQEKRTSYLGEERDTDSPYETVRTSDYVDVKMGEMSSTPNPESVLITKSPFDGFGPEMDVSFRFRLMSVLLDGNPDKHQARGLSGHALDALARKYGLIRMGMS